MANLQQGFPHLNTPMVDPKTGLVNQPWTQLFVTLWNRTGGAPGNSIDDALVQSDMDDADINPVALDQATLKALALESPSDIDQTALDQAVLKALMLMDDGANSSMVSVNSSNGMLPLVTGDTPGPVLIADGSGQCIGVPL